MNKLNLSYEASNLYDGFRVKSVNNKLDEASNLYDGFIVKSINNKDIINE